MSEVNRVDLSMDLKPKVDPADKPQEQTKDQPKDASGQPENSQAITPPGDRPAWLPEKFKTPEDLAKSYTELEKRLGQKTPTVDPPATEAPKVDVTKYEAEFAQSGKLSDESYAELEKAGHSKAVVDNYIQGQAARASQFRGDVFKSVGISEEDFGKIGEWATKNLSPSEVAAYNEAANSWDSGKASLALTALKAKHDAAFGKSPNLLGGRSGSAVQGFKSEAEMVKAMSDKRYSKDPAYRAEVEEKIRHASF